MARQPPRGGRAYAIALVLTALVPGLGHLYAGRYLRGAVWVIGAIALGVVFYGRDDLESPLALTLFSILTILAAVDVVVMLRMDQG